MTYSEEMEMPTMCICGDWFELTEGSSNHDRTRTICENCAIKNNERQEKESNIESYESEIEEHEREISNLKNLIEDEKHELERIPEYI